jgi:glutaminyl-tRNA synthetase
VIKDAEGNVIELKCSADLETGCGMPADGRKVRGTVHWVSTEYAVDTEIRLYDRLFTQENVFDLPEGQTYMDLLNPDSLTVKINCKAEPALKDAKAEDKFQFVRNGYFCRDMHSENVFNLIVNLKDSYKA